MKDAGKIIFVIMFVSALLLLYVHEQIALFRISYRMDDRAELLTRKSEEYRQLRFEVEQLKAPRLLEEKIKERQFNLALPKEIRVVRVPIAPVVAQQPDIHLAGGNPLAEGLLQAVSRLVGVAQAKTES